MLILGNGWIGTEAFKASFWAGQFLDSELNITVASQNASAFGEQVLSTSANAPFPALRLFSEEKRYANLLFRNIDVETGVDQVGLTPLDFQNTRYNYIIVSLGDAEHNWLAASEMICLIRNAQKNGMEYSGKIVINIFNDPSNSISLDDRDSLIKFGLENEIEVNYFGDNIDSTCSELERVARNLNFCYEMKYDQRTGKNQADVRFEESKKAEFIESPFDYQVGDLNIVNNFVGAKYKADSSLASAVHVPVKLVLCAEQKTGASPIETLKEAIRKKNSLFDNLCELEHRRWNAYMIMRGYRAPTMQEEQTLLYHGENTHQVKENLLHICLCDSGKHALENEFDRQYHKWIQKKCPKAFPSELDRASLRCHQLARQRSKKIDVLKVVEHIKGDTLEYVNLRNSILKLANDEENSLALYQKAYSAAINHAISISKEEFEMINAVDFTITPMKTRNARTDFFALDTQMVEMIPFSLWYELKYGTVITICDGMETATQDVIVPTLFCSPRALFIGRKGNNERYRETISSYFVSRGSTTTPEFVWIKILSVMPIYEAIDEKIQALGAENVIINCISTKNPDAMIAIGKIIEKYGENITVVQYQSNRGIVSFSGDRNIGVGLVNKSVSLSEYLHLRGGRFINEYAVQYSTDQYDSLLGLFKSFSEPRRIKNKNGQETVFNIWAVMSEFFSNATKDEKLEPDFNQKPANQPLIYHGQFSNAVYSDCKIGNALKQLQQHCIIRNLTESSERSCVNVSFEYCDVNLKSLLHRFELGQILDSDRKKTIKFIPMNDGLKISDCMVCKQKLWSAEETEYQIQTKRAFMMQLSEKGFIYDLDLDSSGVISFAFKDDATMSLFKKQGSVFELIVYYVLQESAIFDDIETGVKIAWNAEDYLPDQCLLHLLNEHESNSFGYQDYVRMRNRVQAQTSYRTVENEIDVIAIKDMSPVFISCKTGIKHEQWWLYEISSLSEHFASTGVMAVSSDFDRKTHSMFRERAMQMAIPLWGTETLWNSERLRDSLRAVLGKSN